MDHKILINKIRGLLPYMFGLARLQMRRSGPQVGNDCVESITKEKKQVSKSGVPNLRPVL